MFYLTVIVFSMAGIPPFAGFFGKYFLLIEAFDATLYSLVFIALFTSLISAYYYIRIIKISFFDTTAIDYESIRYSDYIYDSFSLLNLPLTFTQAPLLNEYQIKYSYLQARLPFFACLLFVPSSMIP
jgi:NADH-quinone oxidoreductase subunit N